MEYTLFPANMFKPFSKMTTSEAEEYFEFFSNQISTRLQILQATVNSSTTLKSWQMDRSITSLHRLGDWLFEIASLEPTSEEFREKWRRLIDVEKYGVTTTERLTDISLSLSIDVGIYLGETMIANNPNLYWYLLRDDTNIDHNQPVIRGFENKADSTLNVHCNPRRLAHNFLWGAAKKANTPSQLGNFYKYWMKIP